MLNGIDSCNGTRFRIRWQIDILFNFANSASPRWIEHQSFTLCEVSYHCTICHSPFVYYPALCDVASMLLPANLILNAQKGLPLFRTLVKKTCDSKRSVMKRFFYNRFILCSYIILMSSLILLQWNLIIKRSGITKPSYNKVILQVPALYISLFVYPDIMRNLI